MSARCVATVGRNDRKRADGPLIGLRVSTDNAGSEGDPQMRETFRKMCGHGCAVKVVGLDCTHLPVGHDHANEVLNIGILNMQT